MALLVMVLMITNSLSHLMKHGTTEIFLSPAQWPCGRVYALGMGGRGFAPRPSHTKDFKNGTQISLALHSAKRDGLGGASYHHPKLVAPCPGCGAHQAGRRFDSRTGDICAACLPPSLSPLSCLLSICPIEKWKIKAKAAKNILKKKK